MDGIPDPIRWPKNTIFWRDCLESGKGILGAHVPNVSGTLPGKARNRFHRVARVQRRPLNRFEDPLRRAPDALDSPSKSVLEIAEETTKAIG